MTRILWENSIMALEDLYLELQGKVEDGVLSQLDDVILALQALKAEEDELSLHKWEILRRIAEAIILIPSVAEALGKLIQMVESTAGH